MEKKIKWKYKEGDGRCNICPCSCCGCAIERINPYGQTQPWCLIHADFMAPKDHKCKFFTEVKEGEDDEKA